MVGGVAPGAARAVATTATTDAAGTLPPVVPAGATAVPAKPRKKRRSRKRVGDALVVWMEKNPGWHTEQKLLEVVITNKMSDASPKRALKIALGKQRGDVFEGDGQGHWKLVKDDGAGPPPSPTGGSGAGRSRAKSAATGKGARSRRLKARSSRGGDEGVDPASAKAQAAQPAPNRGELKGGEPKGVEVDSLDELIPEEQDAAATRTVLVKRGQDRKQASLAPGEIEARQARADAIDRRRARWDKPRAELVERARKNLLGLGPAPKAASGE
ncbi:MAG: hypothetical protein CSA66_01980 [Proteobacteria bacterium]|nr:MAG: hypothetical protein CSA66_01980 [Pseudomonadota bacterium]